ncbi:MAG: SDR family oxidoreductase [Gammaproteobacteria bacterium]|nr:SDR family oxidoreductase [Boseongicola sp. SB0665_bin_10]MYA36059.1 SDR family oxidoreductase [Gammaproteobacteria bacterium]MYF50017.1 SDR family oxidoreductase [Gammaproteobacteria bacterium]
MRRVLVTGGGTGIGRAIAHAFDDAGDHVIIAGRRTGPLDETAGGRDIAKATADVADEASVAALFDKGAFDVVVANAGAGKPAPVRDMTLDDWRAALDVNLTGTFLTFREALRAGMGPGGRLIATASTASLQGGADIASYVAAKHGVLGLVRSLAKEVARATITCNAVCPGFVDTDMAEAAITGVMERLSVPREQAEKMIVSDNPMKRLIDPSEVAAAVIYLASPEAASVNGHALTVSGGEI